MKLPIGEICRECRREIDRRASRIGRLVAAVTTLGMGIYILLRMPADRTARTVGVIAIVIWYVLTNLIVKRALREHLK